jgi:hypothetical protein
MCKLKTNTEVIVNDTMMHHFPGYFEGKLVL